MRETIRIADLRVSKLVVGVARYVYPIVLGGALIQRRRNQRIIEQQVFKIGATARTLVEEAKGGSQTLRRLTYAIAGLTLINTGFVIYSAVK